jgi:hypothetical protein
MKIRCLTGVLVVLITSAVGCLMSEENTASASRLVQLRSQSDPPWARGRGAGESRGKLNSRSRPLRRAIERDDRMEKFARLLSEPSADLAVSVAPVLSADSSYTIEIADHGPAIAKRVGLVIKFNPAVEFRSVTERYPGGMNHIESHCDFPEHEGMLDSLSCTLSSIVVHGTWSLEVNAQSLDRERLVMSATVSSSTLDPLRSNNAASLVVPAKG